MFKSFIKNILKKTGFILVKEQPTQKVLNNIFNTSHDKYALFSYIKNIFEKKEFNLNDKTHTNKYTSYLIAEILDELGYKVDVINYNDNFIGDISKYDLVIGMGKPLDNILQFCNYSSKMKVVYFATGCNPFYSNPITIKRIADFYQRNHKLLLESSRYITEDWPLQHEMADWIIVHGSHFAKSTFRNFNIDTINAPVFITQTIDRTDNDWETAKNNYIWFGSDGAIHKGLDLVIDSFKGRNDISLHICGNLNSEKDFIAFYNPIIEANKNIIFHGFMAVDSDDFKKILHQCAFVIYPSASEGNSPAVITCMANGGLIPIVTKNADINLNGYGILVDDLTVESVENSIKESQKLAISEIKNQSAKIIADTKRVNTFEYFKVDFKQKLESAIQKIAK